MPVSRRISESTVRRLSHYLRALEGFEGEGGGTVSSEELASRGQTTAAQVRKDLSHFGSFGKRGLGYNVEELYDHRNDPMEWTNLAGDPRHAAVKKDLARRLPKYDAENSPRNTVEKKQKESGKASSRRQKQ